MIAPSKLVVLVVAAPALLTACRGEHVPTADGDEIERAVFEAENLAEGRSSENKNADAMKIWEPR